MTWQVCFSLLVFFLLNSLVLNLKLKDYINFVNGTPITNNYDSDKQVDFGETHQGLTAFQFWICMRCFRIKSQSLFLTVMDISF